MPLRLPLRLYTLLTEGVPMHCACAVTCAVTCATGMYIVFLKRWRREHAKLLLLRAEAYHADVKGVLTRCFGFLGLKPPASDAEWQPMLDMRVQLAGTRPAGGAPAQLASTTAQLRDFYAPGLNELVVSMRDDPEAAEWRAWADG